MSFVDLTSDLNPAPSTIIPRSLAADYVVGRPTSVINRPNPRRNIPTIDADWPKVRGYEILSLIGCGGMGLVFKACQRDLNRIVALKTLRSSTLADDETRERFQSEAEAVARLQHPNIVQVFEVGSTDSSTHSCPIPFIALEFVDGGSLLRLTGNPQSPRDAATMVVKLARAVELAHRLGIVHRDLKPANVLMTRNGEPKIGDFGLAKQLSTSKDDSGRFQTNPGVIVGTPEYMAPEQASGAIPSPAVDIYALGIILYELLTARVPFQGANPVETMDLVRQQETVSPRQLQPSVPRDLDTICLKCLEKDPTRRYPSADALADDLQRFLDHRPIQARRVSYVGKIRRWCRRNPAASVSLVCVVSMFLAAFAVVTRSYWKAEDARQQATELAQAERMENYYANIGASANALQVFNVESARRTLDAAPEELRNWEWRHFQSRLDLTAHTSEAIDPQFGHVVFSSSGRLAVRWRSDNKLVVWDVLNRHALITLDSIREVAFCNNEESVAITSPDRSLVVVDIATGKTRAVLQGPTAEDYSLRSSGDGTRLFSYAPNRTVRVWNANDGRLIREFMTDGDVWMGLQTNRDGRFVAGDQDEGRSVAIWDVETAKRIAKLPQHKISLLGIKFSPLGDRILTIEGFPGNVGRLWESTTGRLIAVLPGHRNTITNSEFSPDGSHVATCSLDQTVRLWNGENGQFVAVMRGHLGQVNAVAFRSDGKRITTASHDHTVRTWDVPTGELLTVLPAHMTEASSARYLPDGGVVASSQNGAVRTWDARTVDGDGVLRGHRWFVYGATFNPDGKRVASASWDSTARIWDATSGKQLAEFHHGDKSIVTSVAFHPDGKILATRSRDGVRMWDIENGKELRYWPVVSGGYKDTRVVFNPQGTLLAAGCGQFEVRLWNVASGTEVAVLKGAIDEIRDVAFSPDGKLLAFVADGGDRRVHIWDVAKRERIALLEGHSSGCYAVAFNPEGTMLASSSTDATVRLWSVGTWKEQAILKHDVYVYGLAFSPDGSRLVSACADSSLRFWDTHSHREVAELRGHNQYYHQVAFSPDGSRIVGACGDCTVRVWDTMRAPDRVALEMGR